MHDDVIVIEKETLHKSILGEIVLNLRLKVIKFYFQHRQLKSALISSNKR